MTKVVKSDLTHPAGFEQLRETLRYIVRLDQIADFIDAYIIQILAVVAATAEAAVFLLLFFQSQKPLSDKRDKRKRSQAGLCFRRISRDKNTLAVDVAGSYRVPDRDGVMLEVNGIPFESDYRITDDNLGVGGQKTKYQNNVAAIRTLKQIEAEGRLATPEEQETLSRYSGRQAEAAEIQPHGHEI